MVFPALISHHSPDPTPVPLAPGSSLPINTVYPLLPSVLSCPLPGRPSAAPASSGFQTFTNEVQLGLLLPGPFKLELLVVAVEFLPREGDGGGLRGRISRIPASPLVPASKLRWSRVLDSLGPKPLLSPFAHQPGQSQVTNDGQNDDPTGCDEIAEGTFCQL